VIQPLFMVLQRQIYVMLLIPVASWVDIKTEQMYYCFWVNLKKEPVWD